MKLIGRIGHLWSTTHFRACELSAYAERLMVEETRAGVRSMSLVFLLLLLGSVLVSEKLGLGRPHVYTCAALAALCVHVYFSARAIHEIKTLHVLGMTLLIISGTAFVLLAHRTGAFGAALFSSVVLLFMAVPMVPWGLREASIVTLLIYGVVSSSTWSVAHRFEPETLWSLQLFMLAGAMVSLTLVARSARVRKHDIQTRFELESSRLEMEQLSYRDPLTGAWNRRFLEAEFDAYGELVRKRGEPLHFALLDIDNFKQLNDTRGHVYGDQVLQWVVESFQQVLGETGLVVRTGGDEFTLLLEGHEPEPLFADAIERIRSSAGAEGSSPGAEVAMSIGLVAVPRDVSADLDDLYRAADTALYQAKSAKQDGLASARVVRATLTRGDNPVAPAREPRR